MFPSSFFDCFYVNERERRHNPSSGEIDLLKGVRCCCKRGVGFEAGLAGDKGRGARSEWVSGRWGRAAPGFWLSCIHAGAAAVLGTQRVWVLGARGVAWRGVGGAVWGAGLRSARAGALGARDTRPQGPQAAGAPDGVVVVVVCMWQVARA